MNRTLLLLVIPIVSVAVIIFYPALISLIVLQIRTDPSPIMDEAPIGDLIHLPNAPDPLEFSPESRCGWYVLCGRYVILNDDDFFSAGDSFELEQFNYLPFVTMDIDKSHPINLRNRYDWCSPTRMGLWSSERLLIPSSNPEKYIHRVTIDVCRNLLPIIKCTVELSPLRSWQTRYEQLRCDDGRIWVLCHSPVEDRDEMKDYCPDPDAEPVMAHADQTEFIMAPTDTISFTFTIHSVSRKSARLIISDTAYELMYPEWERFVMPPGFSVEGGNQRSLILIGDQTLEEKVTISTDSAEEGIYRLIALVYYQDRSGWEKAGSSIRVTVVREIR